MDVEENLVVYVLMLQAAARRELAQKDLRIFSDSGGFADFFPADDRLDEHEKLLEKCGNLETFNEAGELCLPAEASARASRAGGEAAN